MDTAAIIRSLDAQIERLKEARQILGAQESHGLRATASANGRRGPRHMSAAARARISAAQKKRWAKVKRAEK